MTASSSIELITPTNTSNAATTTTTTISDDIVSSSVSRIYHTIRTSSPRESFSSTQPHDSSSADCIRHMKKHCVDPPEGNSNATNEEALDDNSDTDPNLDDPPYDWSSISSMDEEEEEDDDDDHSMTDVGTQSPQETTAPSRRRKVTFGMMEVYEVPALSDYRMDDDGSFWYTTMDMISTRRAGRLATMNDASVKNYLYYYEFLYRKLQDNNEVYTNQELLLSELDAKILAYGLRGGYQGLERESRFEQVRQQERRNIVKLIVEVHQSMKSESSVPPPPTSTSTTTTTSTSNDTRTNHSTTNTTATTTNNNNNVNGSSRHHQNHPDNDEALRTFAISLTNTMSKWAVSLGHAAHLAMDE